MIYAEECQNFKLGVCDCDLRDYLADFVLLGDRSASVTNSNYKQLASDFAEWIPAPNRVAFAEFATETQVHSDFDDAMTGAQVAQLLRSNNTALWEKGTSTFMRRAFDVVWDDIITPDLESNGGRYANSLHRPYMIVLTDGKPTTGQGLCENGQPRSSSGNTDLISLKEKYSIVFVTLDNVPSEEIECMGTVLSFNSWADSNILSSIVEQVTQTCSTYSSSPYNGGYSIDPDLSYKNERPVYRHSEDYIAYHNNEGWVFEDPSGILKDQGELKGTNGRVPGNGTNHLYFLDPPTTVVHKPNQQVCCLDSATPTRSPSASPSTSIPSQPPITSTPTGSPTTTVPTTSPVDPSKSPTTSLPSPVPSMAPSTHSPTDVPSTSIPSKSPLKPTESPATSEPSQSPSTSGPTFNPTYRPTNSPSRSPTTCQSAADEMKDACESNATDIENRIKDLNDEINKLKNGTDPCQTLDDIAGKLGELTDAKLLRKWQDVIRCSTLGGGCGDSEGFNCSNVPVEFCDRIQECRFEGGTCRPFKEPETTTAIPVEIHTCKDDTSYFIKAVTEGALPCSAIPKVICENMGSVCRFESGSCQ